MEYTVLSTILPLLTVGLAVPLIFRKIPPNPFYGLRTRSTFSSRRIWYAANRIAGIWLAVAGMAWLGAGLLMPAIVGSEREALPWVLAIGPLSTIVATVISLIATRRLSP
jgi:uncharacterized membrane protein